ncbi:hypothetical protein KHS38_11600 [Mucilaginibacter sp. Bleaf8]|uniref:hypothetical protein n=1 Tax=Mucilaginibacter sp. Bleaf8 TaxID=2834430 RepID=UPI001BCAC314|nr:hypothetical protein [Mucilaginibacter sp. Bleaf8]MBS7565050.1 hypothetical protein [Mucilaginibacter sp. Bleaf8]
MSDKTKKMFLIASVVVPLLLYCVYYYGVMIKNAPYRFSDLQYIRFEYGEGDSLINKYNSKTGAYQFVTKRNELKVTNVKLNKDELLYLHRKAADLGFWNFPAVEENTSLKESGQKTPHFMMEYVYKNKTKKVLFDAAYDGDRSLKDANERLIKEIQKVLNQAELRTKRSQ